MSTINYCNVYHFELCGDSPPAWRALEAGKECVLRGLIAMC